MTHPMIVTARETLENAAEWLRKADAQIEKVQAEVDAGNRRLGEITAKEAAHEKRLQDLTARQVAEHEARRRELRAEESALAEREREAERKVQWAREHEVALSNRAADLAQRYRGAA
jgi:predicted  nucleic acid-binding Zn-ribbon protein